MPNYGKHLPILVQDYNGNICSIRRGIPYHLLKALKNIKRHKLGSRRYKYWENVKNRFKNHWLLRNINDLVTVQPMSVNHPYCFWNKTKT